jgi:hypothetical protein
VSVSNYGALNTYGRSILKRTQYVIFENFPHASPFDPFIKLGQRRIAFTTTGPARGVRRHFFYFPLNDPFTQHTSERVGIHVEMIDQIDHRNFMPLPDIVSKIGQYH